MTDSPVAVYVHFPWCERKCPYCDFATRPHADPPSDAYADAVLREIDARRAGFEGRTLGSVFFGGGTPSMWAAPELGRVLHAIRGAFASEVEALEVTVECNPNSLTEAQAQGFAEQGVGRLSVGVQSLDDDRLRFLGRLHDRGGALRALRTARSAVPRVSADLMFGLPEQSTEEFTAAARQLVDLGLTHVSTYALTIEAETPFGALHRKGKLPVAREETVAETFEQVREAFAAAGFEHYEVSNHARPGEASRHNALYWEGADYLGLGVAAVGALTEVPGRVRRRKNTLDPAVYMAEWPSAEGPPAATEVVEGDEVVQEGLMLGLRTRRGVHLPSLEARARVPWDAARAKAVARRLAAGDLEREGDWLRVPPSRWIWLDTILADIF